MKRDTVETENQLRLFEIDKLLREGNPGYTREQITNHLRKHSYSHSLRTFNRDMKRLIELGAPVEHKYQDGELCKVVKWYYKDTSWTISKRPMTRGVLLALLLSQHVMEQYAGLPIAKDIRRAFDELTDSFSSKATMRLESLLPISFAAEQAEPIALEIWSQVASALIQRRRLRIMYQNRWGDDAGKIGMRDIAPYHIVNLHGAWYLLGSASYRDPSTRQYAFSQIRKAEMLKEHICIPDSFDIRQILAVTFGQFIGDPDKVEEIHVRFSKKVAPLVMSRRFSARERKETLPNGDIDLRFPASAAGPWPLYHIRSWVLSWGADAKVIAPESLKDSVRQEIRKMAAPEP
ncbi:MAG: WYL domain-containing protein [bacterium]